MADLLAEKSFALVLEDLRQQIGDKSYALWFSACRLESLFRGTLTIGVPDVFHQDWIQSRYAAHIQNAVKRVLGITLKVAIKVDGKLQSQHRQRIQDEMLSELLHEEDEDQGRKSFANFVRVPENETAYRAVRHLVDNEAFGFNPLYIVGPAGVGKIHLAATFRSYRGGLDPEAPRVLTMSALRFTRSFTLSLKTRRMEEFRATFDNLDVVVFDEVHRLRGKKATQQEFLHLLRRLIHQRVQVILIARHHPREIHDITASFKSNLMAGMMVEMPAYSPASLRRIAASDLSRRAEAAGREDLWHKAVSPDVIAALARHCQGSVRELLAQLRRAHVLAVMNEEALTAAFVEEHLDDFGVDSSARKEVDALFDAVCFDYGVERRDLISKRKTKCLIVPRALAACLLRDQFKLTYKEVGQKLGGRSHTSVYMMIKKYSPLFEADEQVQATIRKVSAFGRSQASSP